jgi:hypothetical protein
MGYKHIFIDLLICFYKLIIYKYIKICFIVNKLPVKNDKLFSIIKNKNVIVNLAQLIKY